MAEFTYTGRSDTGELQTGKLDAKSVDSAAAKLASLGVTPLEIKTVKPSSDMHLGDLNRLFGGD